MPPDGSSSAARPAPKPASTSMVMSISTEPIAVTVAASPHAEGIMAEPLAVVALALAAMAAIILIWYLIRRPPLNSVTKIALLFGLGVLPIASAVAGNIVGFENTTKREFCGSCHVMVPY